MSRRLFCKRFLERLLYVCMGVILLMFAMQPLAAQAADRVQPVGDVITIVIDPGHGGSNQGTESGHTIEKHMTMVTATAMYEELLKYDNVQVYMTHTDDVDLSLKERAEFAASVNADFLFSIHYNASENHTMFGTEVWISCETPFNAYGYQFGYQHLESFRERGLFVRGVKNRMDDKYHNDYYGIIRESAMLDLPAVIIEHCYVDNERDADYIKDEEDFKTFGKVDALSVARYFGLRSTALGVDYSDAATQLQSADADSLVQSTLQDRTAPEICQIDLVECDYDTGELTLLVSAADYDSTLIYFDYSVDNGQNWSRLEAWPGSNTLTGSYDDTFKLNLKVPGGRRPGIVVRAYNISDLYRSSNVLYFDQTFTKREDNQKTTEMTVQEEPEEVVPATEPVEHARNSLGTTTFLPAATVLPQEQSSVSVLTFLKFCLALVVILFLIVLSSQMVSYSRRKKRRKKK